MSSIAAFFGSSFFFIPFLYFPIYLFIERKFSDQATVQCALKAFTVLAGLFTIIYAVTATIDFPVLIPGRPGMANHVPASVFLVIVGAATMTLPLYSKHIKFSNKMD